jgi:Pyruvate/2-oxoacid:ferredoxin oxidoreductase delta subunit
MNKNTKLLVGGGVVIVVLVLLYMWNKNSKTDKMYISECMACSSTSPLELLASKNDVRVTYHYSPGCGYCVKFSPEWDKFAQIVAQNHPHVKLEKINCNESPDACRNIRGVPSITLYKNGVASDYTGERTANALLVALTQL